MWEVIGCKKEKTTATKKQQWVTSNISTIIHLILATNFTFNSNPAAASTPISTSKEQNLKEEKQEDPRGKRDKWVSAQTHRLVAMWKEKIQGINQE